jgi:hypothetical protein
VSAGPTASRSGARASRDKWRPRLEEGTKRWGQSYCRLFHAKGPTAAPGFLLARLDPDVLGLVRSVAYLDAGRQTLGPVGLRIPVAEVPNALVVGTRPEGRIWIADAFVGIRIIGRTVHDGLRKNERRRQDDVLAADCSVLARRRILGRRSRGSSYPCQSREGSRAPSIGDAIAQFRDAVALLGRGIALARRPQA